MKHSSHAISMLIAKYRAVVQKSWWRNLRSYDLTLVHCKKTVCAAALLGSLIVSPGLAAAGETFIYDGTTSLQDIGGRLNSVGPATLTNTTNNMITINYTSGADPFYVFGAYTLSGNVSNNMVNLITGMVRGNPLSSIYGGLSESGTADNNIVNMTGGTVNGNVFGAWTTFGNANSNTVNITGGTVNGNTFGGRTTLGGEATHNSINFSGGVTGGAIGGSSSGNDSANYNTVNISGGTVIMVISGEATGNGNASNNTITISDGRVIGNVQGGTADDIGNADNNMITISGGTIGGNIIGGGSGNGNAVNNTVNIFGSPDLTAAELYGGIGIVSTGNTLNLRGYSGSVAGVQNFQNYNFYLPASATNGATILTVTNPVNLSGTAVTITGIAPGGASLHTGDTITLISSTTNAPTTFSGTNVFAGLLTYNFVPVINSGAYQAQVAASQANPQTKSLSEGRLAAVTNLTQGQNLLAGNGMKSALDAISDNTTDTFAAMSGGHYRYDTGSHVDMNGGALLAGIGRKNAAESATTLHGFFLETGKANYSTYNSFVNLASIRGDGDSHYFGAGYLGHKQQADGRYFEGSVRGGQVKSTFRSGDLLAATGVSADYEVSASYYGMHLGIGKVKAVNVNRTLDTYTKFLWTHQNANNVVTAGGDPVNFEAVDSVRWQLGTKMSRKVDEHTTVRTGLVYQYEFGAKANASVSGYSIDTPSLKGSSGILEFGVTKKYDNSSIDFSLQGFSGKSKGMVGNIEATFKF